jgi:hypothetical protein
MAGLLYVRTSSAGTGPDVAIDDLGYTVVTGAGWTLLSSASPAAALGNSGQFTARDLRDSRDLYDAITGGNLEWSKDGSVVELAADYVADYHLMQDFSDDTLDLTDGGFVFPNGNTTPASGIEGQAFWDADDDSLYLWDGTQWIVVATSSGVNNDHGVLTGLLDDDHPQYLLLSGNATRNEVTGSIDMSTGVGNAFVLPQANDVPSTFVTAQEGQLAWDSDEDILWAYDGTQWFQIAPASGIITDHGTLTGLLDDDHTQYSLLTGNLTRNTFTGGASFSSTSGLILPTGTSTSTQATVEGNIFFDSDDNMLWLYDGTQWISVPTMLSGVLDHGTLIGLADDDHPQYGHLQQNETVSGLWTFDPVSTDPNIVLDPRPTVPSTNVVDGAVATVSGIVYSYDGTRSKWLSIDRKLIEMSKDGFAKDVYLRTGNVASSQTGYRALRSGTITGIFAQTDTAYTWTIEVRRNGVLAPIASLAITAATGSQQVTTNVDFNQGDELQLFANTSGSNITAPVAGIEIAWKI